MTQNTKLSQLLQLSDSSSIYLQEYQALSEYSPSLVHPFAVASATWSELAIPIAIPIQAISAEIKPIHKWTYRDILKPSAVAQEEWKAACQCKLDILCKCKVYELVDPAQRVQGD